MHLISTIVIGAGQAGLAVSRCLTDRGVEHVVLERGRLAERWRSERWDSLRLLTPNWMTRLPSWRYDGSDPDGFMSAGEVLTYLERYARSFDAPVLEQSTVESLTFDGDRYVVVTTDGTWRADNVVIATGWCDRARIPVFAQRAHADIYQLAASRYRNPAGLPDGGVLVVGASASGVQLAEELNNAGRDVVLAVGRHTRVPRRYRGMDIYWWMQRIGLLDKTIDEMADQPGARHEPSPQLLGSSDRRSVDLATLHHAGVVLTGHLSGVDGQVVIFADDLVESVGDAERRMRGVLAEIDRHIERSGLSAELQPPATLPRVPACGAPSRLDLRAAGIGSVIWATGHRRVYPWLRLPILGTTGEIRQRRGVTVMSGLYVLGQRFQHFRNSNFVDGVGRDAAFVADHLTCRIATPHR